MLDDSSQIITASPGLHPSQAWMPRLCHSERPHMHPPSAALIDGRDGGPVWSASDSDPVIASVPEDPSLFGSGYIHGCLTAAAVHI
jgi:hypothetical protein